ncbi:hypothetical protein LXL04_023501 [Taraxacum kok-saghyz]
MNRRFHPDSVDSQSRFEKNRFNFDFGAASIPTSDLMRYTKNRFNFDFFRFTFSYFTRGDIHAVAGSGCPSIDRKVVNSGKRLRAYIGIDEGNVSQNLRLRLNSLIDSTTSLHAPQILPFSLIDSTTSLHAPQILPFSFLPHTDGLNKIQTVEEYLIEIWKAVGMNLEGYNEYLTNPVQVKVGKVSSPTENVSQNLEKISESEKVSQFSLVNDSELISKKQ